MRETRLSRIGAALAFFAPWRNERHTFVGDPKFNGGAPRLSHQIFNAHPVSISFYARGVGWSLWPEHEEAIAAKMMARLDEQHAKQEPVASSAAA